MNDGNLWDRFLSSFEGLVQTPPSSVKEGVFSELDRAARRRRRLKRGTSLLLIPLLFGGAAYFISSEQEGGNASPSGNELAVQSASEGESGILSAIPSTRDAESGPVNRGAAERDASPSSPRREDEASSPEGATESESIVQDRPGDRSGESASQGEDPNGDQLAQDPSKGERVQEVEEKPMNGETGPDGDKLARMPRKKPKNDDPDPELASKDGWGLDQEDQLERFPRFFVGGNGLMNFTRFVDPQTIESFESTSLIATEADRALDVGVEMGVQLTHRSALVVRYFAKEEVGQDYEQYVNGRFHSQRLRLTYRKFDLLFEQDVLEGSFMGEHRSFLSLYGGGHYSILRQAERSSMGEDRMMPNEYEPQAYGVDAGLRFGVGTSYGLEAGVLLNASMGLSDIRQDENVPEHLSGSSQKTSVGVGLSLRYRFGQEVMTDAR